jgi:uncharacterized membrane protein
MSIWPHVVIVAVLFPFSGKSASANTFAPQGETMGVSQTAVATAGTNNSPVNRHGDPGASVDFALDIINSSGGIDGYTLSSSAPVGWGVTFYEDTNRNGFLDMAEAIPISAVGPVAAFAEMNVIARVDVPAVTVPGVYGVSFTATSNNNGAISDTIANTVTVGLFRRLFKRP